MTEIAAKLAWCLGVMAWCTIRYRFGRRLRHVMSVDRRVSPIEHALLFASLLGLFIVPLAYVVTGQPAFADYPFRPWQMALGVVVFAASLWMFYRSHKDLGTNWSMMLEIRDRHRLVTQGVYARVRHPMYAAFWLWAMAQALLLPNWVAGLAGIVGFGIQFLGRVRQEERMMLEHFGDEYRQYMARTSRIVPGLF